MLETESDFPGDTSMLRSRPSRRNAYTLIELIMVVALLGIAAAILGPQLINLGRLEASSAVRRLVADITFAQSEALAAQSFRRIHFFDDGRGYCLLNITESDFNQPYDSNTADYVADPSGLVRGLGHYIVDYSNDDRFGSVNVSELELDDGGRSLTFDSLGGTVESPGTPAGEARIVVTGEEAEYEVTVAPVTGKVSVLRIDG
jgi:prepilin-type N-terminal cleavage/methylation domain-containing protein